MTRHGLGRALAHGMTTAVLATALVASPALSQSVDVSKWSPEYVRSIAGTEEFDTVGNCNAVTPTDYKGRLTFWYQSIAEADPQDHAPELRGLFRGVQGHLSKHRTRGAGGRLQHPARQVPHGAVGQCRADGHPPADPRWRGVRLQGLSAAAEAGGRRLRFRRFLARRDEVGDLGGADLRHPHQ